MRVLLTFFLTLAVWAGSAAADPALGVWLTQPDKKGQVAHVNVQKCAKALCGRIIKAFDSTGQEVMTPNVGKQVFWNMVPQGNGAYEGRAWVPAHNREYDARMQLSGNTLIVKGCLGPVCQSQKWQRVK